MVNERRAIDFATTSGIARGLAMGMVGSIRTSVRRIAGTIASGSLLFTLTTIVIASAGPQRAVPFAGTMG